MNAPARPVPPRTTRKPTGKPSWPMMLLAGVEKSGKSWSAAAFSASDMVGRTFFIEVGEHYADEYGRLPGVRYEIVPHNGTYRDIATAVEWAVAQPRGEDGKPNCVIFDSGTVLWEMLSDQAHRTAYRRWRKKNPDAPEPEEEVQVTMDLWNIAKDKFADIARMLYQHDGPSIITGRLEQVAVVVGGKPTNEKAWKVRAEKNLPFEVDVVVQARAPRTWEITGLRSTRLQLPEGKKNTIPLPGFTVEDLLRKLGHDEPGAVAPRSVTLLRPDDEPGPQYAVADAVVRKEQEQRGERPAASQLQRTRLVLLMKDKLGITDRDQRIAAMSRHLKRRIDSFTDLTPGEAHATIQTLAELPDRPAPSQPGPEAALEPRTQEMPAAAVPVEAATPQQPAQDPEFQLAGAVGPEGICAELLAAIEACADQVELEFVGQRIKELAAKGILHTAHYARLDAAFLARSNALAAATGEPVSAPDRYAELVARLERAGLDGDDDVDTVFTAARAARTAGEISSMQLGVLSNMAEQRAQQLVTGDTPRGGWSHRALANQGMEMTQ